MEELEKLIAERTEKRKSIDEMVNAAQEAKRELTDEEVGKVNSLKEEVRELNTKIEAAQEAERVASKEKIDELERKLSEESEKVTKLEAEKSELEGSSSRSQTELTQKLEDIQGKLDAADEAKRNLETELQTLKEEQSKRMEEREINLSKALVDMARGKASDDVINLTAELSERSGVMADSNSFLIPSSRLHDTTDEAATIAKNPITYLSILGKKPMWEQMGVRYLPNLVGTIVLPYKDPEVAQLLAEAAGETGDVLNKSGIVLSPERFQKSQLWSKEMIASENPVLHSKMIADLIVGVDRKITAEVYKKAEAAATEVSGTAFTKAGLDLLMGQAEVEMEGVFASPRADFFTAKSVAIDAGSGRFLIDKIESEGVGRTYEGVKYFYSSLFANSGGATDNRIVYGDFYEIVVGDWGMFEVIVDIYTAKKNGQVEITVSRIASVACQNPAAFAKTVDTSA